MSFNNHPGGGFSEVKGYNPPAGSMADEQRRQREADEARRRSEESARQSERIASQQREWERDQARAREARSTPKRGKKPRATADKPAAIRGRAKPARTMPARSKPARPAVKSGPWNPVVGVAAFIGVTAFAASRMSGENRWILACAIGAFAGFVLGKLWKPVLVLAVIAGGAWMVTRRPGTHSTNPITPEPLGAATLGDVTPPTPPTAFIPNAQVSATEPAPAPAPLPALAGYLFVPGDVSFEATPRSGAGHALTITHTPYLDHSRVRWLQYDAETGLVITVLDGVGGGLEYYDLGVVVPPELREAWRSTLDVTLVHRHEDGTELRTPATSYPVRMSGPSAPAGAP